jgi:hypothetical protein
VTSSTVEGRVVEGEVVAHQGVDLGIDTLPAGLPEFTLAWGVIEHASTYIVQPNGPRAGLLWRPTKRQARFLLWWYAVDAEGRWLFQHAARRQAKGSGKSPFAAVWALEELVGPVRVDDFDPAVKGGVRGKPQDMALVQIAATAESQTANTMRQVRAMCKKGSRLASTYGIDVGKTIFYTVTSGELQVITSSANAAEGAEVTAAVEDETEHWTPTSGGIALKETLDRNLGKSGSRGMETANAWVPGAGSVAEDTWRDWSAEQSGLAVGDDRTLYDAVIAPATPDLTDRAALEAALRFVYADCSWIDIRNQLGKIYKPTAKADVSRRFYLNQPTASDFAWCRPQDFWPLARPDVDVAKGERIALFFDGSKSRDATALVGCRMSDGHTWVIGSWEAPNANHDGAWQVPSAEVDARVDFAFRYWRPVIFLADVREWEGYVKTTWPNRYALGAPCDLCGQTHPALEVMAVPTGKDPQAIAWDMRSHSYEFGQACELTLAEIIGGQFTHGGRPDGADVLSRHVSNAVDNHYRGVVSIQKETPDSPRKIDAAVCMVGARMARRLALAAAPKKTHDGRVW